MHHAGILRRWLALLVGCILLAGCTPFDSPAVKQAPDAPPEPTIIPEEIKLGLPYPPPIATSVAETAPTDSLFKRRDDAPPGVAALQVAAPISDTVSGTCQGGLNPSLGPHVAINRPDREIGQRVDMCLTGFAAHEPITLALLRPDGATRRLRTIEPLDPRRDRLLWLPMPAEPLGAYTVTARQGATETTAGFSVLGASRPRVVVVARDAQPDQRVIEPGQSVQIVLAGFAPSQTVALHLYRQERESGCGAALCERYLTTIRVPLDQQGQALSLLSTRPDDPPATYRIVSDPAIDPHEPLDMTTFSVGQSGLDTAALAETPAAQQRQVVTTMPDLDLWTEARGGARVAERPRLYQGTLLTVLEVGADAVEVRTDDDVRGWLRVRPATLSDDLGLQGERVRFAINQRVQVIWPNGLPLRTEPRSTAGKLRAAVKRGAQASVAELRGDWLRVTLDDGTAGWLRWYYDGNIYVEALGQ